MDALIANARFHFHERLFETNTLTLTKAGAASNADTSSRGSRAIAGKIVDILVEAPHASHATIKEILEQNDYICMAQRENRSDFNKGYLPQGFAERVFHLHLRVPGDNDEIYFRDYLNNHPEIAHQYEELKLALWKPYEHDRDGYTAAKTEFVKKYTQLARRGKA